METESESPGEDEAGAPTNSVSGAKAEAVETARKRPLVLIVDNDPAMLNLMQLVRDYLQIDIQTAATGQAALTLLKSNSFDAIILDCHLPDIDSFKFASSLKKLEMHRKIRTPIIAVAAKHTDETEVRCFSTGVDAYLVKPVNVSDLKTTLEQLTATRSKDVSNNDSPG